MKTTLLAVGLSVCGSALSAVSSRPIGGLADGSFASPGLSVKPKFRYWLPDASVDPDLITDDIRQLGERGVGGTELLNYFRFPATGVTPSNWTIYGYGEPGYKDIVKVILKAHKAAGMLFDFAGSENGCVPAEKGNPALAWELVPVNITIEDTFTGKIPGWGNGNLVSVVTYAVTNVSKAGPKSLGPFGTGKSFPAYTISNASLTDVTILVQANGTISVTPVQVPGAQYYGLSAFYTRQLLGREVKAWSAKPQNIFQNGSVAVDHFSAAGAKVITDFLEDYVLDDESKQLFKDVGHLFWEDSVEIDGDLYWTPGLEKQFLEMYKYDLGRYVLLLQGQNGYQTNWHSQWRLDTGDGGVGVIADFRNLLTILSKTYTDYLTEWGNRVLGLQFSGQWGYNFPIDMLEVVPNIEVPEAETLSFNNHIDAFLQFSGPADLSGKPVLSIELAADQNRAYSQSWSRLLYDAKHAFAGGINRVVIHGAIYSHNFYNTTWPGYTSHNYGYAAPHSRHQPAWDVGYPQALGYLARVQYILQSGVPKVDLIFWDKQTAQDAYPAPLYWSDDLMKAGYSYEYLSPANFVLKEAVVQDRVFAPTRQAAKLLILRSNDTITPDGVSYLAEYAAAGLPIIIYGDLPNRWATANKTAISASNATLKGLLEVSNVHQIAEKDLAAAVASIGIKPRTQISSNGTWWTRWRETTDGETFIFIYNDKDAASTGNITFAVTGTPYLLNAWTGEENPIVQYIASNDSTTISLSLNGLETAIVRFSKNNTLKTHVVASSDAILGFTVPNNGSQILAKVAAHSNPSSVTLSTGENVLINSTSIQPTFPLANWTLTLEHWLPQENLYDLTPDAKKINYSIPIPTSTSSLQSWSTLGYKNVSGIGYYSTTFQWTSSTSSSTNGAHLTLPPITHGISGTLNNNALPIFDITNPVVDITPLLITGSNELRLRVSSTLMNSLGAFWGELETFGVGPVNDFAYFERRGLGYQSNGIVGVVRVVPFGVVRVV
ncbi:hypothetical protein E6O75_ATG09439 [Venturia nashicola]|uniref:Secreted protein n=1 Tax=Venturia nashicola TaxID=86259 RepID=A0A4Z1NTS4_9PEZI|nr:hypothetical protein E6O75_ATG09439 [Venturia nashicola]